MTKEEFIDILFNIGLSYDECGAVKELLEEFFNTNICIHKGNNRHPFADVLHEALEGNGKLEARYPKGSTNDWKYASLPSRDFEYRIKPTESVYEWQWYRLKDGHIEILNQPSFDGVHQFFSESEVDLTTWVKFEETKRERK